MADLLPQYTQTLNLGGETWQVALYPVTPKHGICVIHGGYLDPAYCEVSLARLSPSPNRWTLQGTQITMKRRADLQAYLRAVYQLDERMITTSWFRPTMIPPKELKSALARSSPNEKTLGFQCNPGPNAKRSTRRQREAKARIQSRHRAATKDQP